MAEQVEPLQFELSRHVLKKVVSAIKFKKRADASWLKLEFIRPSTEHGVPVSVDSNDPEFFRIQDIWLKAVEDDPTLKDEGALILKAKKNGVPVSGIDLAMYRVHPDAAQSNITAKPAQPQPVSASARHPTLSSGPVPSSSGGFQVHKPSPTAVSPTSSLRSSYSPEVPDNSMMRSRSNPISEHAYNAGESQKATGMVEPHQQSAGHAPAYRTQADQALPRRRGYSGSTAYSTAATTVTFQANITTGPNVVAVPFNLDNINETIDDVVAYVNWKNSEAGRLSPVDYNTFLSIMRFRPGPANALVVHKAE
ncbi:hypothetical protein UCDDS831_g02192 [Diplodia seriata]|uniref:Uncharacterized protein n=1 Tax=Diplodia seriata TaxID=420778 RepID=A0A0G2EQ15_9PEZI|nr:hypothetical protein UCDDS831_g02192 [Diplodia seriata]